MESDRIDDTPEARPDPEVTCEARTPKIARQPDEPTAEERRKHNVTHCPYRSWCRACVLGRGKDRYHGRIDSRTDNVPRIAMDYMFFTSYGVATTWAAAEEMIQRNGGQNREILTVLVLKDFMFGAVWAYPVRGKGLDAAPEVIDHILGDLDASGLDKARIVIKSDQEASMKEIQDELGRRRRETSAMGTAIENSRVGDSSSNGRVERCIQELAGQVRTLKIALEERLKTKIQLSHPLTHWIIKHAAGVLNQCQVREAGKTAHELLKGR